MTLRFLAASLAAAAAFAQAPSGRWDGTVAVSGLKIPFKLYFEGDARSLTAAFANGDSRTAPAAGSFENGTVRLRFGPAASLEAKLADGALKGDFVRGGQRSAVDAVAYCTCASEGDAGPDIVGQWKSADGSWRVNIRRQGDDTFAAVERAEGKLGPLAGRFNGAFFELAYFDGERGAILEIEPRKDGSLDLAWKEPGAPEKKLRALRAPKPVE